MAKRDRGVVASELARAAWVDRFGYSGDGVPDVPPYEVNLARLNGLVYELASIDADEAGEFVTNERLESVRRLASELVDGSK